MNSDPDISVAGIVWRTTLAVSFIASLFWMLSALVEFDPQNLLMIQIITLGTLIPALIFGVIDYGWKPFLIEFPEAIIISLLQIRANKMRSALTALGVIIGIVAVTLMGTAIGGIDRGFQNSLAMLGDDVVHVDKWPWGNTPDWWNYVNRPALTADEAERLNKVIETTPNSLLEVAVPVVQRNGGTIKNGGIRVSGVQISGTTSDYSRVSTVDYEEGRLFTDTEANGGRAVCVLGYDVAKALFPERSALDQMVLMNGQPFRVIGVLVKQGAFLGLFSFDNQALIPLNAYRKQYDLRRGMDIQVKITDKNRIDDAKEELIGSMRRVRGQMAGERDNFSVNGQQAFKDQLDPIKKGIAIAGLLITGLSLFVGAIGIMNITFVSVKERTKEIGTRKALGARRRTILLQFLIEAVSICFIGGLVGLTITFAVCTGLQHAMPSLPVVFSVSLMAFSMVVSIFIGIVSGFAPALGASRLDPVVALRYE